MSDNSPSSGGAGDIIATDELLLVNGVAQTTAVKAQRIKVGFGTDGELSDVTQSQPLPVSVVGDAAQDPSQAQAMFLTGQPGGDFQGVNLLEEAFKGQLQMPVLTPDLKKGADGGLLLSDGFSEVVRLASVNRSAVLDMAGYGSFFLSVVAAAGCSTVAAFSNEESGPFVDQFGFGASAMSGLTNSLSSVNATTRATNAYSVTGRYLRITASAASTPFSVTVVRKIAPIYLGVNVIGSVTAVSTNVAGTALIGDVGQQYRANATGAATTFKFTAAASTNAASIKASAGRVVGYQFTNLTAAVKYIRFFNKASAPTMGTDSPVFVVPIPANGAVGYSQEGGIGFATGIAFACTNGSADLDVTVTAALDVLGSVFYA